MKVSFKGCLWRYALWALLLALAIGFAPAQAQNTGPAAAASNAASAASAFRIQAVDDAWRAALPLDAHAATQAYLDRLPADVVARSNAYYEGGYWLQLWNWLAGLAVALLLLATRPSTALRDWATRQLKWAPLRDGFYGAAYAAAGWLLTLPLTVYQGFVREHNYGMATQTFAAWFGEQLVGLAVSLLMGAVLVAVLYAVLRRAGAQWWLWGTGVMVAFMALAVAIAPIWIEPLFNTYKPVPDGPVKTAVLAMARANGVPVDNVYVFDASRQTTRVSANVSGLFGTAAIRLNDNLLNRSSEPEILAVMAHEIGHYAMNHIPKSLVMFGAVILFGFLFAQWAMRWLLARYGARWRLDAKTGVADVASLPLLVAVFSTYLLLATPVLNTITRTQEVEADLYGLNLAREPHGEAEVLLKLVEYRKPDPGALEELIFFTHPGTRTRIYNAMRWREQMR
ncbi:MAG: M48 family metallopeptidase [Rubrivivax sp.]|nr:M48 family metallopeptidase [Rubrivivax sp.]MDP3615822.1 M48 family metallopeptidase [Rubrivivax sp.]